MIFNRSGESEVPRENEPGRSASDGPLPGRRRGCRRVLRIVVGVALVVLLFLIGFSITFVGTGKFGQYVATKIAANLEAHLGRKVHIGRVIILRTYPITVILEDITLANVPEGEAKYFAKIDRAVVKAGVTSFYKRVFSLNSIEVDHPQINLEIFGPESPIPHNFPHWKANKPTGNLQIVRVEVDRITVKDAEFAFLDHRHQITAHMTRLASVITPSVNEQIYQGTAVSPAVTVQIQDYEPLHLDFRGGFRYDPGTLKLTGLRLDGEDIHVEADGKVEPITEGIYDFAIRANFDLKKVKKTFLVDTTLDGPMAMTGQLHGDTGTFVFKGGFRSPKIIADQYTMSDLAAKFQVDNTHAVVDVTKASFEGGAVTAHYVLNDFSEPYPMVVDLGFRGVSLEQMIGTWGVSHIGLAGAATGTLHYTWNKNDLLGGHGTGIARLSPSALASSRAKYPIPVSGTTKFGIDNGVIRFASADLDLPKSKIHFAGTLAISDLRTNFTYSVRTGDFSEIDRIAYNLAHATGNPDFTLLGLGGSGTASGTLKGKIDEPVVAAHIEGAGLQYNHVLIGETATIDLTYDGPKETLGFRPAVFRLPSASMTLRGTLHFLKGKAGPVFDLQVTADNWPVERALDAVDMQQFAISGRATGELTVKGTPEDGTVTFSPVAIAQETGQINVTGTIHWLPGEKNVVFNLDVAAESFPVQDLLTFLDMSTTQMSGLVTGTMHLEGPLTTIEGAGSLTLRNGSVYGQPIETATADILFRKGEVHVTHLEVTSPAGHVLGEATYNFETGKFGYVIKEGTLQLGNIALPEALQDLFGGTLHIVSSGAGTMQNPELVLEATLESGQIKGVEFPPGAPAPTLYLTIRNGEMSIRGSAFDVLSIEGSGSVAQSGALDGSVTVRLTDIGKFLSIVSPSSDIGTTGSMVVQLDLGGKLGALETIRIEGTVPELDLQISGHPVTPASPIRFALNNGALQFESFQLRTDGSTFDIAGSVGLTGEQKIDLNIDGAVEAALLQLFLHDLKSEGQIGIRARVGGTVSTPRLEGTAEVKNGQFRFAGFPQLIDNVNAALVFQGDRLRIDSFQAVVGGGTVNAGGFITLNGLTPSRVRINATGKNVSIRYFEGLTIDGDFTGKLEGGVDRMILDGNVTVNRAVYSKDFDFATSILNLILERRELIPALAASWQDRISLDVKVSADDTLAVKNNIADITASAEFDVIGTLANPVLMGQLTIDEGGKVDFQDVQYRVVRGTINFQNPFRNDPYFDLTAEGRLQDYQLTINVTGTLDHITPTITSDPPISDLTLLSLLGPGPLTTGAAGGPRIGTSTLETTGSSLVAESLGSLIGQRILPFADAFRFEPGLVGDSEQRVTFEKQISDNLRVILVYYPKDPNRRNAEIVEWQVNPEWVIQATGVGGEAKQSYLLEAIDARFRRRYEGHFGVSGGKPERPPAGTATIATPAGPAAVPHEPLPTNQPLAPEIAFTTPTVESISFRTDSPFDVTPLADVISLSTGKPLDVRDLQSSIQALYATGNFRDIQVAAEQHDGAIDVTILLSLHYLISDVGFEGLTEFEDRAKKEMVTRAGSVLSLNAVDRSAVAIQTMLARRGWLESTVDPEVQYQREQNLAKVIYHVAMGPRAKVTGVEFTGSLAPFGRDQLIDRMKERPGSWYSASAARNDADRIRNFLVRKDYRRADVRYVDETYDSSSGSVTLHYRVDVGLKVRVAVTGVPRSAVHRMIPFGRNEAYSQDAIATATDAIIRRYQQKGYFFAAVDVTEKESGGEWVITFDVVPGETYRVGSVRFEGNETVSDKQLRKLVATKAGGGFRSFFGSLFGRGGLTQAQLNEDRDAIAAWYRLHGFTEVSVGQPVANRKPGNLLEIVFPITEGPQTIVRKIEIVGNEGIPTRQLPALRMKEGDPLNPQLVTADLIGLRSFYSERGYPEVQVTPHVEPNSAKTSATLTYQIAEGPKVEIGDVAVRGNTYTRTDVVLKKAGLKKGEPFSYRTLLEAQRELYRMAIFERVEVQPEHGGTTPSERNVTIDVTEGKDLTVAGALGYSSSENAPRVTATLSDRNLFGTGRYAAIEARVSQPEKRYLMTYTEPFPFNYNVPAQLTVFRTDENRTVGGTENLFHVGRWGTFVELAKVFREQTRWSLRYEYKLVDFTCRDETNELCQLAKLGIPTAGIPAEDQGTRVSSLTPTFFFDQRDDPVNPHRGFYASASLEYAFRFLNADASFLKSLTQGAWYLPLTDRSQFVVAGRIGMIEPLGTERQLENPSIGPRVPISEKFTAGGESSHRAFERNGLGVLYQLCPEPTSCSGSIPAGASLIGVGKNVYPIGGNALVVFNTEYQFPIFGNLQGATFLDIGQVWGTIQSMNARDLRYGAGAGLRYVTPLGPLRLDVGFKFDRKPYEDPYAVFLTLGYPF
ncbi:MAG: outer membrane protein assembly factor BamA [Thermoanaerobaculia bacterium]